MTDLDVALRLRLAYEGAPARTAIGDLAAIRGEAAKLGGGGTVLAAARDLGALGQAANVARVGVADLAAAGDRLRATAATSQRLTGDLRGVATAAAQAGSALGATGAVDWGPRRGDAQDWAAYWRERAGPAGGGKMRAADWAAAGAPTKEARAETERLAEATAKLGAAAGPKHLADTVAAVAPAAVEARREIDAVARSAVRAGHDMAAMGQAPAAGAGDGAPGEGGGHGGHGAGGGWHAAAVAAARPLHMERLLASAMTPIGIAGLGAGVGAFKAYEGLKTATDDAIALETAMAEVRQSVGTMPAEGVKALEGAILRTSRATGTAAADIAHMTASAAAAGRPAAELSEFMELGAKAAGGFGGKVDEVGERLTRIGAQFTLDQKGLQAAADAAALLQERTGARGAGTLDFMAQTGEVGRLAGLKPDQLAAYGATFGQSGLGAGEAASTFTGLLDKLENAPKQGEGFQLGLSRMAGPEGRGESAWGLRNLARADPSAALTRMLDDIKRLPKERRETVLTEMFGADDGQRLARIADHVGELRKNLGLMDDTAARSGSVERVFKVFDETTSGKLARAGSEMAAFATKIGSAFTPAIAAAAEATAKLFGGLNSYFDASDKAQAIVDKQVKGEPLSKGEQADLDTDPKVRSLAGLDPDPAATSAKRERERLAAVKTIRDMAATARETGDPQIRMSVEQLRQEYGQDYPDKPLPGFARGGPVSGPGGPRDDRVPALLSHGEFVVNAAATAEHRAVLEAINGGGLRRFADGGVAGALRPALPELSEGARASSLARLEDVMTAAVKEGVVAGFRDVHAGRAGGIGEGAGGAGAGGASEIGGEGGGGSPNLRYGRAGNGGGGFRETAGPGRGAPNLRYGRAASAGSGRDAFRSTPAGHGGSDGVQPTGAHDPLKDLISTHETGGTGAAGYETAYGHAEQPGSRMHALAPPKPLTEMTLGEVLSYQHEMKARAGSPAFPVGRAQWTESTLRGLTRGMPRDTKFTPELQEKLFDRSIAGRKGQGPRGFRSEWDSLRGVDDGTIRAAIEGHSRASAPAAVADEASARPAAGGGQFPAWMNDRSKRELSAVNADLARDLLAASDKTGVRFNVAQGLRNQGEADANARSGRGVRDSQHLYGAAADLHMLDAQGKETYDRGSYKRFGDAFEALQRQHGQGGRWLGNLPGRWGSDIVHFDQGIGYGQRHARSPYGEGGPTKQDVADGNHDAYTSPQNPFLRHGPPPSAAAAGEDRLTRARPTSLTPSAEVVPARFGDPNARPSPSRRADVDGGAAGAGGQVAAAAPTTVQQHFYGNHDPAQTARYAQLEQNREIRRTQGRALHGIGRVA